MGTRKVGKLVSYFPKPVFPLHNQSRKPSIILLIIDLDLQYNFEYNYYVLFNPINYSFRLVIENRVNSHMPH